MGRTRRPDNQDLPDFVRAREKHGTIYYSYQLPDGRERSLGVDRGAAVKGGRILNERFAPTRAELDRLRLIERIQDPLLTANPPLGAVIERFAADELHQLAATSRANRKRELGLLDRKLGRKAIQDVTTYHVAQVLKPLSDHARKAHRNAFKQLWMYAKSEGFTNDNPVADTRPIRQPARQRARHTWAGYVLVRDHAAPWLAQTMDLGLYSLQRRGDLVALPWSHVDLTSRTFQVRQSKTGVWLNITMGDELAAVFQWFADTGLDSPYVVHRKPERRTPQWRAAVDAGRQHPYQVRANDLSHRFAAARDRSGAYDALPRLHRPAFHDIRALGIFALARAGYPVEYIQALAGHADVEMTRHYMAGHEQIRPIEVEAGLSVADVDWENVDWNEPLAPALQQMIEVPE